MRRSLSTFRVAIGLPSTYLKSFAAWDQTFLSTPETNVSVGKSFVFHKLTNLRWHLLQQVSFSFGGGRFLCRQNAWYVYKTVYFTFFLAKQPPRLELELCGKDCDKQNVNSRCSLAFCDLTPSWVRLSDDQKMEPKMKNIAWKHLLFFACCLVIANTSGFGWFALRAGSHASYVKKTPVFAIHLKLLVEQNITKK